MRVNPILATDSYKLSHSGMYPGNMRGMYSYIEARIPNKTVMLFGLQMWIKKHLSVPITMQHVVEAEDFAKAHGEPFDADMWEYIVTVYKGAWPVQIYAVPEGLPIPSQNVLVSVVSTDRKAKALASHIETQLLRAVWYPSTIASLDYETKKDIAHFYRISGADMAGVDFALHDFGGRGVTCAEQAEIGGAAHLINFKGSDTIEGVRAANYYYNEPMAGFSVPATEHSVECAYGSSPEDEKNYLRHIIQNYAKKDGIVSIVLDGYDVYRATAALCEGELRDMIINSGAKVVFRPDSGDMMEVVPRILNMQAEAFGVTTTSKGYRKPNHVGLLQGDGIDRMRVKSLLGKILVMGFSADSVVLGSGGGLLQAVTRDTLKFAQKASAVYEDEVVYRGAHGGMIASSWKNIYKDPITDPGKKSKTGLVKTYRSELTGEYSTFDSSQQIDSEYTDVMRAVYITGDVPVNDSLAQIRERCRV